MSDTAYHTHPSGMNASNADSTDASEQGLAEQFLGAWRQRERTLLRYARRHLGNLIPRSRQPETALEAARLLRELDLWFASEELSRVEQHQRLYDEVKGGSLRRAGDLTPEQRALMQRFLNAE